MLSSVERRKQEVNPDLVIDKYINFAIVDHNDLSHNYKTTLFFFANHYIATKTWLNSTCGFTHQYIDTMKYWNVINIPNTKYVSLCANI